MPTIFGKAAGALAVGVALSGCAAELEDAPQSVEANAQALTSGPQLIATGVLAQTTDLAPFTELLENGLPQNVLGGIGSGLAWAGDTTFVGIPDRGPNATTYTNGAAVDNTTSFISRFETLDLKLSPASSGSLPFTLTAALKDTTLLYSATPLVYGNTAPLPSAVPVENAASKFHFTGRSDNFGTGVSTIPDFARLDPEGVVISNDGKSVFIADEYGPYVYQFDRLTGRRQRSFTLPAYFAISKLNAVGALEISGNTVGRVTNKGMEGLTITPDGSTLVGLMQSPLLQDGGDGGRANRIITIDIASGATHEYIYDNIIGTKAFNSSEIIALNEHQFLIDTRDGKGLGDGSTAVIKQLWAVDIASATDVSGLSGASTLLAKAVQKKSFLDIVAVLNANGIASTQIPAKIEGLAFGQDVLLNGVTTHTLYVANDNDFVPDVAGPSRWYVFGFNDADLSALGLSYSPRQITPLNTVPPVVTGPGDLVVEATGPTGASVSFVVTANDDLQGQVPVSCSPTSGSVFGLGATPVHCSAQDVQGNVGETSFTVTVQDTTGPQLSDVPGPISAFATQASGAVVSYAAPSAVDAVAGTRPVSCSPASGSVFAPGSSVVSCAAQDSAGNQSTAQFAVNVTFSAPAGAELFLQPINSDGTSIFKLGRTIPVKFALTGASAGITNLVAKLYVANVSAGVEGSFEEAESAAAADSGNTVRYDASAGQYIFNLSTKSASFTQGTWAISAALGDGVAHTVHVSLVK